MSLYVTSNEFHFSKKMIMTHKSKDNKKTLISLSDAQKSDSISMNEA